MTAPDSNDGGFLPFIVGIGGTPRSGSSSERAMSVALESARVSGARILSISGSELLLPMYTPDFNERDAKSSALVQAIRECDGLIIASPAYHGSVSGLIKNALDYTEDLRTDPPCLPRRHRGRPHRLCGWLASRRSDARYASQYRSCLARLAHASGGFPEYIDRHLRCIRPLRRFILKNAARIDRQAGR